MTLPPVEVRASANAPISAEVGDSGLRRFGYQIDEEFDPNLKGLRGVRKFDEMRKNDPDVGAILTAIEMSIRSVDWFVEPGGETAADKEAAEFLDSCRKDMEHTWEEMIGEVLTMIPFGWAYLETVYKLRQGEKATRSDSSTYDDGRIGWRKIVLRGQESLKGWNVGPNGEILGMMQWSLIPPHERYIPKDRAAHFRTSREKNNPEGKSMLRNAYRPWYIKTNVEEIEVIAIERDMTGVPVIRLPVGATEQDKNVALDILKKLKADEQTGIVLPRTGTEEHTWWDFEVVTSSGQGRINSGEVVARNSTAIARSVLAQFLTVGQGRVGSYALVKDFRDLFHLSLVGLLDNIAATMNADLVAPLFRLNRFSGLTALPRLNHGRMGQRDVAKFATTIMQLAGLGLPLTNDDWDFIRDELEMPKLPDGFWEEKEKEEEAAAEEAAKLEKERIDAEVEAANNSNIKPVPGQQNPKPEPEPGDEKAKAASEKERTGWLAWLPR